MSRQPDGRPEIFYSVQGEGINLGRPAVFLRLALCNLACVWCDTRYTWDWKRYRPEEQIVDVSPEQAERKVLQYSCRYLVVTGGEPLLQQAELIPLLDNIKKREFYIEIETNGTIVPRHELTALVDHWSVSPKLGNSGLSRSRREIPEVYAFFAGLASSHFKYVIETEGDLGEVQELAQTYNLAPEKVLLMPEASTIDALLERSRWLIECCKIGGYLFSTRLQVLLWGSRRGV